MHVRPNVLGYCMFAFWRRVGEDTPATEHCAASKCFMPTPPPCHGQHGDVVFLPKGLRG